MYLENRPAIHLVEEYTHFQAAEFLKNQSINELWKYILSLWIYTYMGPQDFLEINQGSSYISAECRAKAAVEGIEIKGAPI